MPLTLEIPDDVIDAMQLPRQEVALELRKELAFGLYGRGVLSMGKAVEFAGVTRREFEKGLARRRIERNYESAELQRDLDWAGIR